MKKIVHGQRCTSKTSFLNARMVHLEYILKWGSVKWNSELDWEPEGFRFNSTDAFSRVLGPNLVTRLQLTIGSNLE